MDQENNQNSRIAAEPSAALYYGTSPKLRESGIIYELSHLDKSDTLWIIQFLQKQLEQMRTNEIGDQEPNIDPMYGLDYLKSIHDGIPRYEELKAEYLQEKYDIVL